MWEQWSVSCLPILADAAIKGTVVLALAWLLVLCMRRTSAAPRHAVWLVAIVCLLLLPLLSTMMPAWNVLPPWCNLSVETVAAVPEEVPPSDASDPGADGLDRATIAAHPNSSSEPPMRDVPVSEHPTVKPVADSHESQPSPVHASSAVPTPPTRIRTEAETGAVASARDIARPLLPWIAAIWVGGATTVLAVVLLAWLSLWWIQRHGERITDGPCVELLQQKARELGVRRNVLLIKSNRCSVPFVAGIFRPRLILPKEFFQWCPERREVVMLHELGHVARWDCLTKIIVQAACGLYWFNPLVWLGLKWIQTEAERACDDLVLRRGCDACDYAEHLLQIAAGRGKGGLAAAAGFSMARPSKLEGRLLAVLDSRRNRRSLTFLGAMFIVAVVTSVAMVIASVRADTDKVWQKEIELPPVESEVQGDRSDSKGRTDFGERARPKTAVEATKVRDAADAKQDARSDSEEAMRRPSAFMQTLDAFSLIVQCPASDGMPVPCLSLQVAAGPDTTIPSIRARRAGAVMPDDARPEAEAAAVEGNAWDAEMSRLIGQLGSDDVESRRNAARQLQQWGAKAKPALPALVRALEDTDGLVCRHAAQAIGQIEPLQDDVIAALVRALGELKGARAYATKVAELSTGLEAVSEVLLKIGEPAVPHLARALSTEKQPLTGRILSLLEPMGPKARAATSAVVHVLEGANTDARTRSQAVSALGRIGTADKAVVPALIRTLGDPSWYVRRDTARALGQIGWPGGEPAVPVLSKAMTGEDYDVQLAAAEALGRMAAKSDKALAPLLLVIRDRNLSEHVREDALQGLGQMGPAAEKTLPDLIAAVDDDSSNVRFRAAEVIAGLGPRASSAVPALRGRLKDVQWPVRREAARALGCIGPSARSAEAALTEAAQDDMPQVRDAAREALKRIRVPHPESKVDVTLEPEIARLLALLQRNPWSEWEPGTEVVREFVDDQREGFCAYTQPDLTYGLAQDGKKLVRIQEVDGKPVEQVFDTSDQTGLVPSAFTYRVGKGVPAQLRIDDVDVNCLRFEDTLVEHVAGGGHTTVYREWVLPTYPTIPLRRETNDNWWRVKSLRNTKRIGDRELACVVVESHMKEAGGHARETQYLSADVPGHLVESVKEIHSKGNDKPLLIHERVAAIRNESKALSSTRPTSEVEVAETDVPEHLQRWGGLYDRVGGKIVDAPAEDVKVAKGYVAFADKGKIHNGRRVTIMTAKQQYAVGEEIRVIHVLEAVEPGSKVFVMGPKTVFGEYVDGKDVTGSFTPPVRYDGRVLDSPAVDFNYVITKYTFDKPGEHTIQWRAAGPFDGEGLASNVLKIEVVQTGEAGGASVHPEQSRADTVLPGSRLSIEEAVGRWAAFAVACEAVEEPKDSGFAHLVPGSAGKWHQYRWDVDLAGGRNAGGRRILNYRVWNIGQQHERPIAKGQRVIWIGVNPAPDHYRGVKALPDTPENREAVRAAFANRPASADKYVAFPERADAEGAAERVALLKRSLDTFRFVFRARLEPEQPARFLALRVAGGEDSSGWEKPAVRITRQQATRIIDHLAAEGLFFRRAGNVIKDAVFEPDTAVDTLWLIDNENDPQTVLVEELQYGDTRRLSALREVLEGEARAAANKLLARLESNGQQEDEGDDRPKQQNARPDSSRAPLSEEVERLRASPSPLKLVASNVKYEGEALPKPPDDVTGEKIVDKNVAYYRSVKANGLVAEDLTANTARAYCMFDLAIAAGWYERKGSEYLPQDIRGLYRRGTGLWMGSNGVGILVYDMKSKVWSRHSVQQKAVPGFHVTVLYGDADYVFATYGYSQEVPNAEPSLHVYSTTHGAWLRITAIPRRDALRLGTSERLRVARGWNHRRYAEQPLVPIGGEETPELAYPRRITRRTDGFYLLHYGHPDIESSWTDLVVRPDDLQAAFERLTPLGADKTPAEPAAKLTFLGAELTDALKVTNAAVLHDLQVVWRNDSIEPAGGTVTDQGKMAVIHKSKLDEATGRQFAVFHDTQRQVYYVLASLRQRGERTQVRWYGPLPQLELQAQKP